jgi:hypothetical protein
MDFSLYQHEVTFSLLPNFVLKSALSDVGMASSACFWAPFA